MITVGVVPDDQRQSHLKSHKITNKDFLIRIVHV